MRALWRFRGSIVALLLVAGLVTASLEVRRKVDAEIAISARPWELWFDALPGWFPPTFRGRLAELDRLPEQVSLRPPLWRARLTNALEANPWIDRVRELVRQEDRIRFSADFLRPAAAIAAVDGFLLIDERGTVIDLQRGSHLHEAWRLPRYIPEDGPIPVLASGERPRGAAYRELVSLLEVMWADRVFDRWPGAVEEILSEPRGTGDRFWVLKIDTGTELVWGRAPTSTHVAPLDPGAKLQNLRQVLRLRQRLEGTRTIDLWSDREPLVVDRRAGG